jgi:hypothetical protein
MPAYDALRYDPPAPVATVVLRDSRGGSVSDVVLLLDTGADVTLLPRDALELMGIQPINGLVYELVGFDGSRCSLPAVELEMIFL